jgi:glycosyltransferase involved in cell wall biosynthesis
MRIFIYFGRLAPEKGFDALMQFFEENKETNDCFWIFGDGELKQSFLENPEVQNHQEKSKIQAKDFTQKGIHFFGRRKPSELKPFIENADYSLMLSRVLETFGLSAQESLLLGTPVLKLPSLKNKLKGLKKEKNTSTSLLLAKDEWMKRLKSKLPSGKKILLITDFSKSIGGTEAYVDFLSSALKKEGYTVKTFSSSIASPKEGMKKAIHNPKAAKEVQALIEYLKPDIICCHSILRFMGPSVLKSINKSSAFKMITYHDWGFYAAFPSKLDSEKALPKSLSFKDYLASMNSFSAAEKLKGILKYFLLIKPIQKELIHFDLHCFPSEYMRPHLKKYLRKFKTKAPDLFLLPHPSMD